MKFGWSKLKKWQMCNWTPRDEAKSPALAPPPSTQQRSARRTIWRIRGLSCGGCFSFFLSPGTRRPHRGIGTRNPHSTRVLSLLRHTHNLLLNGLKARNILWQYDGTYFEIRKQISAYPSIFYILILGDTFITPVENNLPRLVRNALCPFSPKSPKSLIP